MTKSRKSSVHSNTQETDILVDLNLDGTGKHQIKSGKVLQVKKMHIASRLHV